VAGGATTTTGEGGAPFYWCRAAGRHVVLGEDPAAGEWRLQCCQFWEGALGWHWRKGDDGTSVMEEEGEVEGSTSSGAGRCMAECGKQRHGQKAGGDKALHLEEDYARSDGLHGPQLDGVAHETRSDWNDLG
jgi:hypothetical protein